jgi:nucleotide-binding universal stress UspA family protein
MSKTASTVRRILLPVDLSRDSLAAVGIAFDLAAALGGQISGLFIEDTDLLTAGSLPFAREVGSSSGIPRPISLSDIEHRLNAVAHKARTTLTQAGRRLKVRSCFRVARGDVSGEILTAAGDADLVVLGKAGWSVGALRKPGKTCQALLANSHVPVLIVERGSALSPPIVAVHDETPAGQRALEFARDLSANLKWDLSIFAVRGLTSGDEVLQRMHPQTPRLIVLPSTLSLTEHPSRLGFPLIFVP